MPTAVVPRASNKPRSVCLSKCLSPAAASRSVSGANRIAAVSCLPMRTWSGHCCAGNSSGSESPSGISWTSELDRLGSECSRRTCPRPCVVHLHPAAGTGGLVVHVFAGRTPNRQLMRKSRILRTPSGTGADHLSTSRPLWPGSLHLNTRAPKTSPDGIPWRIQRPAHP